MKYFRYILFVIIVFLSAEDVFSQSGKDSVTVIFSIQDLDLDPNLDTIPFIKEKYSRIYFYDNKVYYNDRKIYSFKNTEYYMGFTFLHRHNNSYIYLYPKYKGRSGPYIWYGLGVLFEINNEEIVIKTDYDYYDLPDIKRLFNQKKHKITRRIKLNSTSLSDGMN